MVNSTFAPSIPDLSKVGVIILAAGNGTRMKAPADKNKVTFKLKGKPMIWYTKEIIKRAGIQTVITVVGHAKESVKKVLKNSVIYAEQPERRGTADAVKCGLTKISDDIEYVIVMCGDDSAFYTPELLKGLLASHLNTYADLSILTITKSDPFGLGRIARDEKGVIYTIIEEKNATDEQKLITEINSGLYCFSTKFIKKYINLIQKNELSNEYYLTDIVKIAYQNQCKINGFKWNDESVWFGVNTPEQLAEANLKGKIAVITGAGGGIGNVLANQLEKEGVICIRVDRQNELLNKPYFECDFSKEKEVTKLVKEISSKYNKIDMLYNIAGIGIYKNIDDLRISEWANSIAVNLTAPLLFIKGLLSLLKKSDQAFVLNFGSGMGRIPVEGRTAYCASKFGLRGMSLSLTKEFKKENIDISLLTLGSCMTSFGTGGIEFRKEQEKKGKKYLDPAEVVKKVIEITTSDEKRAEYTLYPNGYSSAYRKVN